MKQFTKIGRLLYGIGIVAVGIHQLLLKDFRQEILPPFPAWPHKYPVFPILTGIALIFAGAVISGVFKIKFINAKNICIYLGLTFLLLIITFFLPYILIFSPDKISRLDVWFGAGEAAIKNPYESYGNEIVRATIALLFCGIALVIATTENSGNRIGKYGRT